MTLLCIKESYPCEREYNVDFCADWVAVETIRYFLFQVTKFDTDRIVIYNNKKKMNDYEKFNLSEISNLTFSLQKKFIIDGRPVYFTHQGEMSVSKFLMIVSDGSEEWDIDNCIVDTGTHRISGKYNFFSLDDGCVLNVVSVKKNVPDVCLYV